MRVTQRTEIWRQKQNLKPLFSTLSTKIPQNFVVSLTLKVLNYLTFQQNHKVDIENNIHSLWLI